MSATKADRSVVIDLVRERPELFHVVCCRDGNAAFCGVDVSDLPFTDGAGEQFCVVCQDLEDACIENDCCPLTGRSCP